MPLIQSGKYRALAVTSVRRSPALPDVPTMMESGVAGFEVTNWFGMFMPAGVPEPVAAQVAAQLQRTLADPAMKARFARDGVVVGGPVRAAFGTFVAEQTTKWDAIVPSRGIRKPERRTTGKE